MFAFYPQNLVFFGSFHPTNDHNLGMLQGAQDATESWYQVVHCRSKQARRGSLVATSGVHPGGSAVALLSVLCSDSAMEGVARG